MRAFVSSVFIAAALMSVAEGRAPSSEININDYDLYVKRGFSVEWTLRIPREDPTWLRVPASSDGRRAVRIKKLGLPDTPPDEFFSLSGPRIEEYTFVTSFYIADPRQFRNDFPGLFIRQIADNWEVYVNGIAVKKELHLNEKGEITVHRNLRNVLIYINPSIFKKGMNILAFRIVGDPRESYTGLYKHAPVLIGNYEDLASRFSQTLPLFVISIYLIIGFFHFILFLYRTSERYNLYFALFAVAMFAYQLLLTGVLSDSIVNTDISDRIEFCTLYLSFPLMLFFTDSLLFRKIGTFSRAYAVFAFILIALSIPTPHLFILDILRVWQATAPVPLLYFLIFQIGYSFRTKLSWERVAAKDRLPKAVWRTIFNTVPGNLLIGSFVVFCTSVFDLLEATYLSWGIWATRWGLLFFVCGITMMLANRFMTLYRRFHGLSRDLEKKSRDLRDAHVEIGMSHERYRILVEMTNDIVFTLDESFRIVTANRTMCTLLGLHHNELVGMNLMDLLYEPEGKTMTFQFIQERLNRFLVERKPLQMRMDFKSPLGIEPIPMQVRLEFIAIGGRYEIFGRGSDISEDILNRFLESERQLYKIGNFLMLADDLSYRITRNLHRLADRRDVDMVRIAVREIILNAIEHGNLGIRFEEKTQAIMADNYLTYVTERQKDPAYRDRSIYVDYRFEDDTVTYQITDEGEGFDYRIFFVEGEVNAEDTDMLPHGRGIALARSVFDEIRYNEKGNSVILIKKFT